MGVISMARRRKFNQIIQHEDYAEVFLEGRHGGSVKIDLSDVEIITQHCWANKENRTAQTKINGEVIIMPRFLLNAKKGDRVICTGEKFDFRRKNIHIIKVGE